jgi:hypothetical protein
MPLDDRLREGLRADADLVVPDTDRHLAVVRGRGRVGPSTTGWLVAATATIVVIAVLVLGIPPGAPSTGPGATNEPTPRASSVVPPGLEGTGWTVTLLASDPGVAELGMAGAWSIRFGRDSAMAVTSPALATSRDAYALDDGVFATNLFASDHDSTCAGPGEYHVSLGAGRVTFSGSDTCAQRRVLLTTRPWSSGE